MSTDPSSSTPAGRLTRPRRGDFTWEDAFAYIEATIEEECARQGVSVEITDPHILAVSSALLAHGRRNIAAREVQ